MGIFRRPCAGSYIDLKGFIKDSVCGAEINNLNNLSRDVLYHLGCQKLKAITFVILRVE